jgi:hypothetical protein
LDLLASFADDHLSASYELATRLQRITARRVDVGRLERVEAKAPLLLDRVLDEGRVLIDRDKQWDRLRERRPLIADRARRAHNRHMAGAVLAIKELTA